MFQGISTLLLLFVLNHRRRPITYDLLGYGLVTWMVILCLPPQYVVDGRRRLQQRDKNSLHLDLVLVLEELAGRHLICRLSQSLFLDDELLVSNLLAICFTTICE